MRGVSRVGLHVERLVLREFRSHADLVLDGLGELNVIAGPNAAGKTNIIEALELLCAGQSHRHPAWGECIRWGSGEARARAELVDGERRVDCELSIKGNERTYALNGKRKGAAEIAGTCPCVLFTPDDLLLVKDSSARRRDALDDMGAALSGNFAKMRADYRQVLRQRNLLLRDENTDAALAGAMNAGLVTHGAGVCVSRWRLVSRLAPHFSRIHGELSGGLGAEMAYVPSWQRFDERGNQIDDPRDAGEVKARAGRDADDVAGAGGDASGGGAGEQNAISDTSRGESGGGETGGAGAAGAGAAGGGEIPDGLCGAAAPSLDAAAGELVMLLERTSESELRRHTTLAGPHKDEIVFLVDGRNARHFASQGQQRTLVLAFKLAQVEVAAEMLGEPPILLLDDVMSELDESHRNALSQFVRRGGQTFVTTANLGYFTDELIESAHVVELPAGGAVTSGESGVAGGPAATGESVTAGGGPGAGGSNGDPGAGGGAGEAGGPGEAAAGGTAGSEES